MEDQIVRHLPRMIEQVTDERLRDCLSDHLEETKSQHGRLVSIFENHGEIMDIKPAGVFEKMLQEAEAETMLIVDTSVRDAYIISAALNVEHLEMAHYETLSEWAKQLEESDDKGLFEESKAEEAATAGKLSGLASGGVFTTGLVAEAVH